MGLFSFLGGAIKTVVSVAGKVTGIASGQPTQVGPTVIQLQPASPPPPPPNPVLQFVKDYGLILGAGVAAFLLLRKKR